MREIGSEFWLMEDTSIDQPRVENLIYLLSGRTALDFIIKDIQKERIFSTVYLPSYCCESMIEPFVRNGVRVNFYKVGNKHIEYNFDNNTEAVLLMDYFGFEDKNLESIAKKEKEAGKIVIYDATHKINGHPIVEQYSDYIFCSYRKWYYCNYAMVKKNTNKFNIKKPSKINEKYCTLRNQAARLKNEYINGDREDKSLYLRMYNNAENMLEHDYRGYAGTAIGVDLKTIANRRRENANYLLSQLREIQGINLWKDRLDANDIPLFIPIFLEKKRRDNLRQYLINNNIYCPIHWPISHLHEIHGEMKRIYDEELSLICDQRYSLEDMEKEIMNIKRFIGAYGI